MKTTVEHQFTTDECQPEFDQWAAILDSNLSSRHARESCFGRFGFGADHFRKMRAEILEAARHYTDELALIAADAGLPAIHKVPDETLESRLIQTPVVGTGHQPVIFHPGILAKNVRLNQLAKSSDAIGLMVSIDTDKGDATPLIFPQLESDQQRTLRTETFGTGGDLYLSQRIAGKGRVAEVSEQVTLSLNTFGFTESAERVRQVMDQYALLSGKSTTIANTIIRRIWEERPGYWELPLSQLVSLPSIRTLVNALIRDGASLHELYNATLASYRSDHKIKNVANPFPDLEKKGQAIELPFWVIDASDGNRIPLFVNRQNADLNVEANSRIIPRGMMITTILRLVASDLFIHGTGGAKYDRCTDRFIDAYLQVKAPGFVATTKTQHLFASDLRQIEESRAAQERIRDVYTRFKWHVESETFSGNANETAKHLLQRRTEAIERLIQAKIARESAAAINSELKAVDAEIASFVQQTFASDIDRSVPSANEQKVLETRQFPYFFFPKPDASD